MLYVCPTYREGLHAMGLSGVVKQTEVRLLHSLSLVAVGLSVGYETWLLICWQHPFVMDWSKYQLGLPQSAMEHRLLWLLRISTIFEATDSPIAQPLTAGKCLPLGLCKETVKESRLQWNCRGGKVSGPGGKVWGTTMCGASWKPIPDEIFMLMTFSD